MDFGIPYGKRKEFKLFGYLYVDWVGFGDDRMFTISYVSSLNTRVVS